MIICQDKTHAVYRRVELFKNNLLEKGLAVGFTINQDTVVMELPEPVVFEWEEFVNSALTTRIMTALSAEQLGAKK